MTQSNSNLSPIELWWETYRDYLLHCGMSNLNEIAEVWQARTDALIDLYKNSQENKGTFLDFLMYHIDSYVRLNEYHTRFGHVPIDSVQHKRPGGRYLP